MSQVRYCATQKYVQIQKQKRTHKMGVEAPRICGGKAYEAGVVIQFAENHPLLDY